MPLFTRHARGVELTEAGEVLLGEAREVLARADRLEDAVEELGRGDATGLRVGVPPGVPAQLLPDLLTRFREGHPDARVEVRELTTPEQVAALADGTLDLGLVREPVEDSRLSRRTLLVEPLGASLPASHPLAGRESVTLRELAADPFVCFPRPWAPSLHDVLVRALKERDIEASFQDSAQLGTTVGKVAAGEGITLSAESWLEGVPGIVWRPLTDVEIEIRTAAAWRAANRSPLLAALVRQLPSAPLTSKGCAEVRDQPRL